MSFANFTDKKESDKKQDCRENNSWQTTYKYYFTREYDDLNKTEQCSMGHVIKHFHFERIKTQFFIWQ